MRFTLFIFLIVNTLRAQTGAPMLHFDKSFYASGEVIWYKLYLPPKAGATAKLSVRATVADGRGEVLDVSFLPVGEWGSCAGYFAVPFDLPSGWLQFRFSAVSDGAFVLLAEAALPTFNDLAPLPKDLVVSTLSTEPAPELPDDLQVRVEITSEKPPRAGQPVRLKISVSDKNGQPVQAEASVSITDERLCGRAVFGGQRIFEAEKLPDDLAFSPGIKHIGWLFDKQEKPIASPLMAALDVPTGQLFFTKSDTDGRFVLDLPGHSGAHELQFRQHDGTDIRVAMEKDVPPPLGKPLTWTQGILDYLDASRKRKKIYQLHGTIEADLQPKNIVPKPVALKFQRSFRVQDYERFADMVTFFRENTTHLAFAEKDGRLSAKMYDPAQRDYFADPPLFLLDGKATLDADFVGRLDPAGVELVEFQNDAKLLRKIYPVLGSGGLVRIRTLSGKQPLPPNEAEDVLALPGYLPEADFQLLSNDPQRPMLAPQIFWNPHLLTGETGTVEVLFNQSFDRSQFCAEILVQEKNGRRGSGRLCW